MPLYQNINVDDGLRVSVWKITESLEELQSMAKEAHVEFSNYPAVKNELRIKQWLATRLLLAHFYPDAKIKYDENGKPHLSNGIHISISHSKQFVGIHFSHTKLNGVDIEEVSEKVARIKHKFLGKNDYSIPESTEELTILWSAKEAMYKYYGKRQVDFKAHLHILDFNFDASQIEGRIAMPNFDEKIQMGLKKIDTFVMVYTL